MSRKAAVGIMLTMVLAVAGSQVLAHHSAAGLFSRQEEVVLSGTVRVWRMVNPHPALVFEVAEGEHAGRWTATFNSVADVRKHGWSRTTFRAGDPTTVLGNPFFGGRKTIFPLVVTTPDGQKHLMRMPEVNPEYAEGAHSPQ